MNRFEPIQGKADIFPDNSNQALWNKLEYLQADNVKLQADLKDLREKMNELNSATLEIVARDIGKVKQSIKEAKTEIKTEVQQLSQELRQNFDDFKIMSGQKVVKVRDELQKDLNDNVGKLYDKIFTVENKLMDNIASLFEHTSNLSDELAVHIESKLNEIRPTIDLVYLIKKALKKLLRIK